jgi:hypothetical protein
MSPLRPGMVPSLAADIEALPQGSLILWADLAVYRRFGAKWICEERSQRIPSVDLIGGLGVVVRVGEDWEVVEDKVGDADAFASSICELMRNDPALRDALRRRTDHFRDLATAIDQLDPRTRR